MKNLLLFFLLISSQVFAGDPISCAPSKKSEWYKPVLHFSIQNGDWFSSFTWASGVVPSETDVITASHSLYTNARQVVIRGVLKGNAFSLQFRNVVERNMVGGMMTPPLSDVGLIVLDDGQLQLEGEEKKSWTNLAGSAFKGATSITVVNAKNWNPGNEIVIVPTREPGATRDWIDNVGPSDSFAKEFERRKITSVSANQVFFSEPLLYDHLQVVSVAKTWTAEVMNLSRSIVIEGTSSGYAHIFIRSSKPQTIKYVEGRFLGVSNPFNGKRGGGAKSGLYGLHFHHCMDGSIGSVVEGNSFHDTKNRVYVPHFSNGILFKDNVAFHSWESMYWWDIQSQSHGIVYDGNIAALIVSNGVDSQTGGGFELGQGDDNEAKNNVSVYTHSGDLGTNGGFQWNGDNEGSGVWVFSGNISHSNRSGMVIWQNTGSPHHVFNHEFYNNTISLLWGAYINSYILKDCIIYNSPLRLKAAPGNTTPMFEGVIFDGGNQQDYLVEVVTSPVPGISNIFLNCEFRNYKTAAFQMNTFFVNDVPNSPKIIDLVNPVFTGKVAEYSTASIYGSSLRVQPKTGQPYRITQSGTSNISAFATTNYGSGTGLFTKYYNGANFDRFAFERIDIMFKFQAWSVDEKVSPNGVHHKISPGGPYSFIATGFIETQYPGLNQYAVESWGGVRLWIDDKLLLDRWSEFNDRVTRDAATIPMEAGKKYKIRIEHFDAGGGRGFQLFQKVSGSYLNVPMSQLYPSETSTPPPPVPIPNRPPVVNAGPDRTITLPDSVIKIEGMVSDPDNNISSFKWSGGIELTQNLSEAGHVMGKVKNPGSYELTLTATDDKGVSVSDKMFLTAIAKPIDTTKPPAPGPTALQANAGPDQVITGTTTTLDASGSTGSIKSYRWYYDTGPRNWNITDENAKVTVFNRLVPGTYNLLLVVRDAAGNKSEDRVNVTVSSTPVPVFKNKYLADSVTCPTGNILRHTVSSGKYTANSQAAADALAVQEINTELSKCPKVIGEFDLQGKRITVYDDWTIVVK